jgi:signal transduction histidine kinase/tetratricopeptide (TPR) repeat protein
MKRILLLLALLACLQFSFAQYSKADLLKVLTDHPQQDTFRVNHLITYISISEFAFDERKAFAEEALTISQKIRYQRGEGYALLYLGTVKLIRQNNDSLLKAAIAFAEKSGDPDLLGYSNFRQGLAIVYATLDKKALDYYFRAEKLFEQSRNNLMLSIIQTSIANFYADYLSIYPTALEYYLKAISSAEKANGVTNIVEIYLSMAVLYSAVGDHDKSLAELQKADDYIRRTGASETKKNTLYNSYGETYRLAGKYNQAIEAYKLAIQNTPEGQAEVGESNLADVYSRVDSIPLSLQHAFRALDLMKKNGGRTIIPGWIFASMSRAYLLKNMPDSALYYGHIGLDTSLAIDNLEFIRNNAEALANAYAYKKDFANAYKYHLQFVNVRDSMLGAQVRNKTTLLQHNVEMDKKQTQIAQLNDQKKAQQNFLISALVVLAVIIIAASLLLRSNRHKQKANQLLQKQKQDIELLGDIGRKISSSLSVETIISTVYDNVNSLMDASVFGIGIYHDLSKSIDFPATYENGKALPAYSNSVYDQNRFAGLCFISGKEIVMGDLNSDYSKYLQHLPNPIAGDQPASLIFLPLKVKEKMFGVLTVQSFKKNAYSGYQLNMLRNIAIYAAIALENAESFKQLNTTVTTLQNTQKQLIQSEKMASLGELTAGIAHEIQNPLNFVNNFSDINKELIGELLEEVESKNFAEVRSIANDIKVNEDKINFHGKRADGIVKGMLQHSRSSTGQKEMTDINVLCDEYLRLAYHGLRAKDKSFNAALKNEFDEAAGSISVVPQDLGRVVLNLLTNAFYAVRERSKKNIAGYQPTVLVRTQRFPDKFEIKVSDNGGGIPANIMNKIFQPFFTTKPTGQGTGLGLSMSYDIVTKAHNGDLKVSSDEEGTEFTILLPLK